MKLQSLNQFSFSVLRAVNVQYKEECVEYRHSCYGVKG